MFSASAEPWDQSNNSGSILQYVSFKVAADFAAIEINGSPPLLSHLDVTNTKHSGIVVWGNEQLQNEESNSAVIEDSRICGSKDSGIRIHGYPHSIVHRNTICNNASYGIYISGVATNDNILIEENLFELNGQFDGDAGIRVDGASLTFRHNTVHRNRGGGLRIIDVAAGDYTVTMNNFVANDPYAIRLISTTADIQMLNNWWGTTDPVEVEASLLHFLDDFRLGTVMFEPFLDRPSDTAPSRESPILEGIGKVLFRRIYDGKQQIYAMNADGSDQTRLTDTPGFENAHPSLSPDGTKIVFQSTRDGGDSGIYIMNADGSEQTRLTDNTYDDRYGSWSPDGSKIVFASNRDGRYGIYVMDVDGTNQTLLADHQGQIEYLEWSPDGSKIVFHGPSKGSNRDIYLVAADGSQKVRLTNSEGYDGCPSWSPDGMNIAFVSQRDVGNGEIYTMDLTTGDQQRITYNAVADNCPVWSPDGEWILFSRWLGENASIYVMPTDGSDWFNLSNSPTHDDYVDL